MFVPRAIDPGDAGHPPRHRPRPPAATITPSATPEPGTEKNPLILASPPPRARMMKKAAAGETIAAFIESRTGYRVVTVLPSSETDLLDALGRGNAHIASLSPFAYLLGRPGGFNHRNAGKPAAREKCFYGAQFIANREGRICLPLRCGAEREHGRCPGGTEAVRREETVLERRDLPIRGTWCRWEC